MEPTARRPILFIRLLQVESWKARRSRVVPLCALLPALLVASQYPLTSRLYNVAASQGFDLGEVLVQRLSWSWAALCIPLLAFVLSIISASWENAGQTYRLWFAHGVHRSAFFAGKLVFLHMLLLIATISFACAVSGLVVVADVWQPGLFEAVPLVQLWLRLLAAYAAAGGLLAIHFWAAASSRGIGRPFAVAFGALFVALWLSSDMRGPWNMFYPWMTPLFAATNNMVLATVSGLVMSILISMGVVALLSRQRVL